MPRRPGRRPAPTPAPTPPENLATASGRDEMNLADFPVGVLSTQPAAGPEGKRCTVVFPCRRYDAAARRWVEQRVVLTTSPEVGLPTSTDDEVLLALIHLTKQVNDFAEPRVRFYPHWVCKILRWTAGARDYRRLDQALMRLKAMTARYENSWWDPERRAYVPVFATSYIAEYQLDTRRRGPRKKGEPPPSYFVWSPTFFKTLARNVRAIDLDRLFRLKHAVSRRLFRYLSKQFYGCREFTVDLHDLAYGHVGLGENPNVASLKRRLQPGIAELEQDGLLAPEADRFIKAAPGVWRVHFARGPNYPYAGREQPEVCPLLPQVRAYVATEAAGAAPGPPAATEGLRGPTVGPCGATTGGVTPESLVLGFYRALDGRDGHRPSHADLHHAAALLEHCGPDRAGAVAAELAAFVNAQRKRLRLEIRYLGGAMRFLPEVLAEYERKQAVEGAGLAGDPWTRWSRAWQALGEAERAAVRARMLEAKPGLAQASAAALEDACVTAWGQQVDSRTLGRKT